jgi:(5-formylfuran-3-yl)methyl phosphate synthase
MRLLVSVANATEAAAALAGGADLIDAKDPHAGALGAVPVKVVREIHAIIGGARPVTAALGDAADEEDLERIAREFAAAGASLLKVGFARVASVQRVEMLLAAAARGARAAGNGSRIICVAYADAITPSLSPLVLASAAARAGATGVLVDTADKDGPGLRDLVAADALTAWVTHARACGLLVACAGKLSAGDLAFVHDAGADIAGVRGAACDDGRSGRVSPARVRLLVRSLSTVQSDRAARACPTDRRC